MTEEQTISKEDQTRAEFEKLFATQQFLTNPARFNAVIWQGLDTLLEKVTKIEEKLEKLIPSKKEEEKTDGNNA